MWTYCIELRQRLLKYLGFLVFCFIGCFYYSNEIFRQVLHPLIKVLTGQDMLVITKIGQGVLLPLELAVTCACILSIPFGLLQLWKFVLPALHKQERIMFVTFIFTSQILFVVGVVFCVKLILPWMFHFLVTTHPQDLHLMLDVENAVKLIPNNCKME